MLLPNYHNNNSSWGHQCIWLTTNLTFNNGRVGEVPFHHFTEGDTVEQRGTSRLFRKIKSRMFYPILCIQEFIERAFKDMRRWTTPVFQWQIWSGVFCRLWQLEQSPQVRRKLCLQNELCWPWCLTDQWHTAKTWTLLLKRQLPKPSSLQNVEQRELETDHKTVWLCQAASTNLVGAGKSDCATMTLPKEKSTCLSKGSLRRKLNKFWSMHQLVSVFLP